jgi:Immunity protein 50
MSLIEMIQNSSSLIKHFGEWPSFHDAEIIDLHCWRGRIKPGNWDNSNVFPVITMKILILAYDRDAPDIVATLRFHGADHISIDDFNHVNQIQNLTITTEDRGSFTTGEKLPPYLGVSITRGFGMAATFRCFRIEVRDAVLFLSRDEL